MSGAIVAAIGIAATRAPPLTVTVTSDPVVGVWEPELMLGQTDIVGAIPAGGTAPITALWSRVSGYTFGVSPSTTSLNVSFTFPDTTPRTAVYRVTVTDAAGQTATTTVTVNAN